MCLCVWMYVRVCDLTVYRWVYVQWKFYLLCWLILQSGFPYIFLSFDFITNWLKIWFYFQSFWIAAGLDYLFIHCKLCTCFILYLSSGPWCKTVITDQAILYKYVSINKINRKLNKNSIMLPFCGNLPKFD